MSPKHDPVPRARRAGSWLGGIVVLGLAGAGVAAAAVVLWENIDIRQIAPRFPTTTEVAVVEPDPPRPALRREVGIEAVVFDSPRNRAFFPDSGYYARELAAWRELVDGFGGTTRSVSDADGLRTLDRSEVLLLPEAPCLSTPEFAAIEAHLDAGGGVVATWAVGARDASCGWVGWQAVAALTGAGAVREIPAGESRYLAVPAGVALSPGLDPGTRIELLPDASLALRLAGPRVYWSDWALNPRRDAAGEGAEVAAVATRSPLGGRIGWLGFGLGRAATPLDSAHLTRLAGNALSWAAGETVVAPAPWPDARQSAAMFLLDVEAEPRNAAATAEMLRSRGVPGTFFVVSALVEGLDSLAESLVRAGEIGSQTVDHTPVANLTAQDQRARLRRSAAEIRRWAGTPPAGLHPPEESFDSVTLAAWHRAGGTYLVASNQYRSAAPELHRTEEGVIVLLPRVLKDDYNIIVQDGVLRASGLRSALLAGVRKARAIGGVGIVAGHTQILRPGPRVAALAEVVDSVAEGGDTWIATGRALADWWRARDALRISFTPPEGNVAGAAFPDSTASTAGAPATSAPPGTVPAGDLLPDLFVTASPGAPIGGVWIDLVQPDLPSDLVPLVDGEPVDFVSTAWGIRVPVDDLRAGQTRRIGFVRTPEPEAGSGGSRAPTAYR